MSEQPIQIMIAAFRGEQDAAEALKLLKRARSAHQIEIQNAAVLRRDARNRLRIQEVRDWGGGKGAVMGGTVGAVLGVLAGPGVLMAGAAGALIGGLAAKLRDSGFANDRLSMLGESLQPGTSALVAVIEHKWVGEITRQMAQAGADVITEAIAADVAQQLEAGYEVVYTTTSTGEGMAASRTVVSDDEVQIRGVVLTDDGIVTSDLAPNA